MAAASKARQVTPSTPRPRTGKGAVVPFPGATLRSPAKELGPRANRTIARILEATRSIFLTRGYAGTTIDEIARVAGISRASFYTYFPTKRDVLLALGAGSADIFTETVSRFAAQPAHTDEVIAAFVDECFELLEEHGSFAFAWTQAAHEDEEIHIAGMRRHLEMCRLLGSIGTSRKASPGEVAARGLVVFSMFERAWSYCQLYADALDPADVKAEIARTVRDTFGGD